MNPWIEGALAFSIAATPLAILYQRTKAKTKDGASFGIGVRTVQLLGAAILPPALIILGAEGLIDGSAVAALIGAFVGYLFSNIAEFDRRERQKAPEKSE